jgi:voltage-dependent potassium channel beta subunit
MDYVDLIFCHRPDLQTPIEETVRAMTYLINQGKALYWGTSEWSATQIMEAYGIARREHLIPPSMEQPQYNMFRRDRVEKEYLPLYSEIGLGTTIWSPLASGMLTGKYNQGIPDGTRISLKGYEWLRDRFEDAEAEVKIEKVGKLMTIADDIGCTMPQLALAWCLANKHVSTVITGASRLEQVEENMKASDYTEKLTDDVIERIESILENKPKPEADWRG